MGGYGVGGRRAVVLNFRSGLVAPGVVSDWFGCFGVVWVVLVWFGCLFALIYPTIGFDGFCQTMMYI